MHTATSGLLSVKKYGLEHIIIVVITYLNLYRKYFVLTLQNSLVHLSNSHIRTEKYI
jgi:hypothetical protein